jgi:integrase
MRRGEILNLAWDRVDLKEGFIHLQPEDTKTSEGRDIPLFPELMEMFKGMPRGLPGVPVFTRNGKPIKDFRYGFEAACKRAGIEDFTFHDLRHTFVTNMRRLGVHDLVIMAITGHKTLAMFKRYNTVSKEDLRAAVQGSGSANTHQITHQNHIQAEGGIK